MGHQWFKLIDYLKEIFSIKFRVDTQWPELLIVLDFFIPIINTKHPRHI